MGKGTFITWAVMFAFITLPLTWPFYLVLAVAVVSYRFFYDPPVSLEQFHETESLLKTVYPFSNIHLFEIVEG